MKITDKQQQQEIYAAYAELELAVAAFQRAIADFGRVYNTQTVGLDYWSSGLDDTLFEIDQELDGVL